MNWQQYEAVTRYIYETLGQQSGVKIEGHGNSCKVRGKSGVDHQIDVLASHSDGIHTYKTAIECKYAENRVNKDAVTKLAEIIEDAGISKGVIVSKSGFTEDAISFARYKSIGLVELIELGDKGQLRTKVIPDIEIAIININVERSRPEIISIVIDYVDPEQKLEPINEYQIKLRLKSGEETPFDKFLLSFKNELHEEEPDKVVEKYYKLEGSALVNKVTKKVAQISGLTLKGKLTVTDMSRKVHLVDKVWLTMKSLFDGKSFSISQTGIIKENR